MVRVSADAATIDAVVFDLGGVLLDWDRRHLYRQLIDDEAELDRFLTEVVSMEWNQAIDLGRPFAEAVEELAAAHPEHDHLIRSYWDRWDEMVPGDLPETVAVLEELVAAGVPCFGLTNFSPETYPRMAPRFGWLGLLRGVVVSGVEGVAKPDPAIFRLLCGRYDLDPGRTFFVDDSPVNVAGAQAFGLQAHLFTGARALREALAAHGQLVVAQRRP